jgi:non-heme chloroperoxidase
MPYIAGEGQTSLFYNVWGTGHSRLAGRGRPVVLMHGWALNQRMWDNQVVSLTAHGLRCITYDRRGHGRSDIPGSGYDYDTLAGDLAAVLDALDLDDVLLVAHSMAAGEAVRYLGGSERTASKRVTGLVLVGAITPCLTASSGNPGGVPAEVSRASNLALAHDRAAWFRAGAPAYFGEPARTDLTPRMQAGLNMCLETPLPVLQACSATMVAADLRDDVRRVRVPTLVIHGDADASAPLPVTGQPTAALLPHARLRVYPQAPHGLYDTHAERLSEDLLDFATTHELATD